MWPDRTAPPGWAVASSTTTDQPASASRFAATRPLCPAPMTIASDAAIAASPGNGAGPPAVLGELGQPAQRLDVAAMQRQVVDLVLGPMQRSGVKILVHRHPGGLVVHRHELDADRCLAERPEAGSQG